MRWLPVLLLVPALSAGEAAPSWSDDPAATSDRVALLIAADSYAGNRGWALPAAQANLEAVQRAFVAGADIPLRFQRVLRGEQVTRDAVESAITALSARVSGSGLMVVYWIGHGGADPQGRAVLFTHWTEKAGEGSFSKCLAAEELGAMTAKARETVRARGSELQAVFVGEVCRIQVGIPPPAGSLCPVQSWEIYGTSLGEFTSIPASGLAPFSRSWADALIAAARLGKTSDLTTVFADAQERTAKATENTQKPALRSPPEGAAPVMARPARVRVRIALDGATTVALAPGVVTATVQAAGYLETSVTFTAELERSGSALELPAYPAVAVIRGTCDGSSQPVVVTGVGATARQDCYRTETRTDGTGAFTLAVPAITAGLTLRVAGRDYPLPAEPAAWPLAAFMPGVQAPTYTRPGVIQVGQVSAPLGATPRPVGPAPATAIPAPGPQPTAAPLRQPPERFGPVPTDDANRWPAFARNTTTAIRVNGELDLTGAGSPVSLAPVRWLVGNRRGVVLDAALAGTPRGLAPLAIAGGPARQKRIVDAAELGTPRGAAPLAPADPVLRRKKVLDLSQGGTSAMAAPLAQADPIERLGTLLDLADAGTPAGRNPGQPQRVGERQERLVDLADAGAPADQAFAIPDALREAMARAVP